MVVRNWEKGHYGESFDWEQRHYENPFAVNSFFSTRRSTYGGRSSQIVNVLPNSGLIIQSQCQEEF